mgnify:CR=1 FL=1
MDVIVLLNHSLFKRRCLLEDHRILIFRVGIASKAELSKTVGDIFVFILLIQKKERTVSAEACFFFCSLIPLVFSYRKRAVHHWTALQFHSLRVFSGCSSLDTGSLSGQYQINLLCWR